MKQIILNIFKKIHKLPTWQLLIISLLFRLPYIIAYFPGLMIWDTGSSIAQFYGFKTHVIELSTNPDAILSNHHMILLTFLFGGAVKLGEIIGNQNIGFFILDLFQVFITNSIMIYGFNVLRTKVNKIFFFISFGLYLVLPVISIWQMTVCKDSLFSAFAVFLIILIYELVDSKGELLKDKVYLAKLILANLLVMFTKQQGVYIVLLTFIIICFIYRKYWIKITLTSILPALAYMLIFTGIILPSLGVAMSGKQEILGFAFQQTARYVSMYEDEVTEEEKENIDKVIPYESITELYTPGSQDPVKFTFRQNSTTEDLKEYLGTWMKMFIKHPKIYFEATFYNIKEFFIPNGMNCYSYFPVLFENSSILEEHEIFTLQNIKPYPIYNLVSVVTERLSGTPLTVIFFQCFSYVWFSIIGIAILLFRKKYTTLICLLPVILSLAVLIISPIVDLRYVLLFIYFTPFLLMIISENTKDKERIKNG